MSNVKVGLWAGAVAIVVCVAAMLTRGAAWAAVVCVNALIAIAVVVFINDAWRRRSPGAPTRRVAAAPAPIVQATPEALLRVLGPEHVADAWNLRLRRVGQLVSAPTKFGGVPDFVDGVEQWPRCKQCSEPMTFLGQVEVGPAKPIRWPVEGRLFLFLCNADSTQEPQCETWSPQAGCSACFVQPNQAPRVVLAEGPAELEALAAAVARNEHNTLGGGSLFVGLQRKGRREYLPYLARQYVVDAPVKQPSAREPDDATEEQNAYVSAARQAFEVQVGGFGNWVQSPIEATCSCGAPMELVLQFDAFDEVINLGDTGRAYVFGCQARHAPDAFFLEWQCC